MTWDLDDDAPPALTWEDIGWANRGWTQSPPSDALVGETHTQYEARTGKWVEGASIHLCGLGNIQGHITEEAKREVQSFAYHLRDHRGQSIEGCRFCRNRANKSRPNDPTT